MTMGGVTPFGLPEELPLWVDQRVMARQSIIVGGGSRDRKLLVTPAALTALPSVEVVADLAQPIQAE